MYLNKYLRKWILIVGMEFLLGGLLVGIVKGIWLCWCNVKGGSFSLELC